MNTFIKIVSIIILSIFVFACVPLKTYYDAKQRQLAAEEELRVLTHDNEANGIKASEWEAKYKHSQQEISQLTNDSIRLSMLLNREKDLSVKWEKQYNDLLNQFKKSQSDSETQNLLVYLQKLQNDLQAREDALRTNEIEGFSRKKELEKTIAELEKTKASMLAQNKRLADLEQALKQKDQAMNSLRQAVANALTGFNSDELKVHIKNGKVYVSLEEKLLFASGSYEVNATGVQAIKKLAPVLETQSDVEILIEGHTDNVPFKSAVLIDNWDLSVKRATSVARILLSNSNINPLRVTSAGRGEFSPIAIDSTPLARQKNRRTEIILTPSLDKVLQAIDNQ